MTAAPRLYRVKTCCKYGHEYTEQNTYVDGNGKRYCRICAHLRTQRHDAARQVSDSGKRLVMACTHGHPYTPENTSYLANGKRRCRACMRTHRKAYTARRRTTAINYVMVDDTPEINLIAAITQQAMADYTYGDGEDHETALDFLATCGLLTRNGSIRRPA